MTDTMTTQVLSSLIAAWDDVGRLLSRSASSAALEAISEADAAQSARTAAGYAWMMVNCLASAGYVLGMRKRIKVTNFKVSDSVLVVYLSLSICFLLTATAYAGLGFHVLQQSPFYTCPRDLLFPL